MSDLSEAQLRMIDERLAAREIELRARVRAAKEEAAERPSAQGPQVDDIGEDSLASPHDHEIPGGGGVVLAGSGCVVEQHLGTVGVKALRGQGVLEAEFFLQHVQCWANPLQRDALLANGGKDVARRMNGTPGARPADA